MKKVLLGIMIGMVATMPTFADIQNVKIGGHILGGLNLIDQGNPEIEGGERTCGVFSLLDSERR